MKYMGTLSAVSDMERAKEFYRRVLELKVTADFGANVTLGGHIFLQTIDTWMEFVGRDVEFGANTGELYFEEDDMDEFLERIAGYDDIVYVHPVKKHAWGQRVVRFYDPDGHIIEVGENMAMVVRRFTDKNLSAEETAKRMDVPVEYVKSCLEEDQ